MKSYNGPVVSRIFIVCFLIAAVAAFSIGWLQYRMPRELATEDIEIADSGYLYSLDKVSSGNDQILFAKEYINISGWLIRPGENVKTASMKVVLRDEETGKYYLLPTNMTVREDVTKAMSDGFSYDYSGFTTNNTYLWQIDTDKDYGIYVLYCLNDEPSVLVDLSATIET